MKYDKVISLFETNIKLVAYYLILVDAVCCNVTGKNTEISAEHEVTQLLPDMFTCLPPMRRVGACNLHFGVLKPLCFWVVHLSVCTYICTNLVNSRMHKENSFKLGESIKYNVTMN